MASEKPLQLSVIYDGGLASTGQLDFYEFSRAAYGFARLIGTIETFRRSGRVPQKITKGLNVNPIIQASGKGSFPIDIIMPIVVEAVKVDPELIKIPLEILFEYVMSLIKRVLPQTEARATKLLELEKERTLQERQRTLQDRERTRQGQQETDRLKILEDILKNQSLASQRAVDALIEISTRPDTAVVELGETVASIQGIVSELQEKIDRDRIIEPYKASLSTIPHAKIVELTRKVRPQVAELGVPLQKSAKTIRMASGTERRVFARFNQAGISDLQNRNLDADVAEAELRLISYDRDGGYGRADLIENDQIKIRKISFSTTNVMRNSIQRKILIGLDKEIVLAEVRYYRDQDGNITSLIIEEIDIDVEDGFN